jgi:hypothetical protein
VRIYPDIPVRRTEALLRDAAVLVLLILFAWLGFAVHGAVDKLAVLGEGVHAAGDSVQSGFDSAAEAVDEAPVVGGPLSDALSGAGEETGGEVAELGERGEQGAHRLADLLGVLFFALPATLVLVWYLPPRLDQIRRLTAADRVLHGHAEPERRRLVAMRAAFALPYGELLRHTGDPLGDLAAERYDALVEAALEAEGLRARGATN